jgi:hypothetical protein
MLLGKFLDGLSGLSNGQLDPSVLKSSVDQTGIGRIF